MNYPFLFILINCKILLFLFTLHLLLLVLMWNLAMSIYLVCNYIFIVCLIVTGFPCWNEVIVGDMCKPLGLE